MEFEPRARTAATGFQQVAGRRNGASESRDVKVVCAEEKFTGPGFPTAVAEKRCSEFRADVNAVFVTSGQLALNTCAIGTDVFFKRKINVLERGRTGARFGGQILKTQLARGDVNASLTKQPIREQ